MKMASSPKQLIVLSHLDVDSLLYSNDGEPILPEAEHEKDSMDRFNHPRLRRALILKALSGKKKSSIQFTKPPIAKDLSIYKPVHTGGLLDFLQTAWIQWESLGQEGQDPSGCLTPHHQLDGGQTPPLIPSNMPLPREPFQRPSKHVIGQMGYYCTDCDTPVFGDLKAELLKDAGTVQQAVEIVTPSTVVYALPTHPGHHAAADSFGGYCYVNHVAATALLLDKQRRVAILDVDYHAGNGTASIFYENPKVLVVSIHCHPNHDYPFHSGFPEDMGHGEGVGATLHLALMPGTVWKEYRVALEQGMKKIRDFGAEALIVSLGLDTHDKDP